MSPFGGLVVWETGSVWIDDGVARNDRWRVLRMELFHAGGVDGHPLGEEHFSPAAVALVREIPGVVTFFCAPDLHAPLVVAVQWWNAELCWGKFLIGSAA